MWPFDKNLESVLGKTKDVRVHGVKFKIKKLDPTSYVEGSKVMLQLYDTYKVNKTPPPEIEQTKALNKIKDHYRDVFLASIVSPKLKRKQEDKDGILVDYLFTEWELAHELYAEIMQYTYGKKKLM